MVTKRKPSPGYVYKLTEEDIAANVHCRGPLEAKQMACVYRLVARVLVERLLAEFHRIKPEEMEKALREVRIDGEEFDEITKERGRLKLRYSFPPNKTSYRLIAYLVSQNGGLSGVITVPTRRAHRQK
jgi:hypothetical protein